MKPKYSRRTYQDVAGILASCTQDARARGDHDLLMAVEQIGRVFCTFFRADNARFDPKRFYLAMGNDDNRCSTSVRARGTMGDRRTRHDDQLPAT